MSVGLKRAFKALLAGAFLLLLLPTNVALASTTAKYADVLVSDAGQTGNSIANSNTSTSIAVGPNGYIYVVYHGSNGIRVARSTNDGQSFDPSVQVLSTDYEPSIAVSATGDIYVSWADSSSNIWIAKSTDNGQTFSSPMEVGSEAADEFGVTGPRVHMAADGTHVYLIGPAGETIYVSSDNGDTFSSVTLSSTAYVFSDVHVDPVNHDVIVNEDNPSIRYYVSTDYGQSFGAAVAPSGDSVNYSVGSVSAGSNGHYLFIAGYGSTGYKIDPIAQTNATVTLPTDSTEQGRSIQADGYGNVVTGYSDGTNVYYAVSHDFGSSFGTPVTVTTGTSAKAAINTTDGDLMFLYTDSSGHVYLNTYANQLIGYNLNVSLSSLSFNGFSGNVSTPQTITVTNKGTSPMTITGVSVTGPFKETNSIPSPLGVGQSGTISVTFDPTTTGTQTGQLSVSIQGANSPRVIQLSGTSTAAPPLSVTTSTVPDGTVGTSYTDTLQSNGGSTPISWTVSKGALPDGLSLSSSGELTGTPTSSGKTTFTVQAKDAKGNTVTQQLALNVNAAPAISTSSLSQGEVGQAYNQSLAATGGTDPITWSVSSGVLPQGLSLSSKGVISGTPTSSGTVTFTVQAKDANGAVTTKQLSIVIDAAPSISTSTLPSDTVGVIYHQTLAVSGGVTPDTWSLTKGALPGGLTLSSAGVISGTPTKAESSTFTVQVKDADGGVTTQQLTLSINAVPTITTSSLPDGTVGTNYQQTLSTSGGTSPITWSVAKGNLPVGLSLSAAGKITGTPTTSGNSTFTIQAKDADGVLTSQQFTLNVNSAPSITSTALTEGTVGASYQQSLSMTGGTAPETWSIASGTLPSGLSLSPAGEITGTPKASGTSQFTVEVKDANGAITTKQFTVTVNATPSITTSTLPSDTIGVVYHQALGISGGTDPITWTLKNGTLPDGLTLSSDGNVSGTPTKSGAETFVVQAKDANGVVVTKSVSLTINANPAVSTSGTLADATANSPYQQNLSVTGGTGPFTWAITKGSLPFGLSLSSGGTITGNPASSGTSQFTVQVKDSRGVAVTKTMSLTVNPSLQISVSGLGTGGSNVSNQSTTIGSPYQYTFKNQGGTAPFAWSVKSGSLPKGLTLSSGGVLSGTPTGSGTSEFTVQVKDANGALATEQISMTVNGLPNITTSSLSAGTVGTPYQKSLGLTGGTAPFTWSITLGSLPDGMQLQSDGTLFGTPTTVGTNQFTVQVKDSTGSVVTQQLSITVNAVPSISTNTLPGGTVGAAYHQMLSMTGGTTPYTWSISQGSLPSGLTLSSSGVLSGTSNTPGTAHFTVQVADKNGATSTQTYSLTMNAIPTVTLTNLPGATVNGKYQTQLSVQGGTGPVNWKITHGTLPQGVSLSQAGVVSGKPTQVGTSQFTIQATDANGVQVSKQVSLQVNKTLEIVTKTLPMVLQGTSYQQVIQTTYGTAPIQFSVLGGTLPDGLTLGSDGTLTGMPASTGTFQFTIQATDANGVTASQDYTLYVIPAAPTETLKTVDQQNIVGNSGTTFTTNQGTSKAVLNVPGGAYTNPIQMNLTTGKVPSNILGNGSNFVAAFGVNFNNNYVPSKPLTLTIYNSNITQNSTIYKIVNGKLVPVPATLSPGKAVITFTSDPDFVVTNPKAISEATSPVTGKPFAWNYLVGSLLLILGGGAVVLWNRKRRLQ